MLQINGVSHFAILFLIKGRKEYDILLEEKK